MVIIAVKMNSLIGKCESTSCLRKKNNSSKMMIHSQDYFLWFSS